MVGEVLSFKRSKEQEPRLTNEELSKLYEEYFPRVYNYVYYRVLNRDLAEELVSDIFLRVVRSYHTYDPKKAKFSTWVFRIAHNCLINYYRSRREITDIDQVSEGVMSTEDSYQEGETDDERVQRLLTYLNDEERELIYLKFYSEKSNVQIGELLGMNASTVSTKVSRAVSKMRAHVDG